MFIVGSCIGSFLNLVIYRVPLNLSVLHPRSHCPTCKKNVPIFGLIPIFGFFLLLGRCFFCKAKISWRYPFIEFICALGTSMLYLKLFDETKLLNLVVSKAFYFSEIIPLLTTLWLFYTGIIFFAIDFKHRILPDIITIPGMAIGVILSTFNPHVGFFKSFFGIVVGFGGLFLVTKIYEKIRKKEGMGFGDVKYLGFIGAVVAPLGVFYTLFLASILGSIVGIIYGIVTKKGLSASIPFGPFLAVAALCVYMTLLC
ncbi:MAG: prepilin peptidase [Bdellovibrionota bacterium]